MKSALNRSNSDSPYESFFSDPRIQFAVVVLLAITFYFSKLGGNGMAVWDDCYYAEKAKEILQTGDWLTMHFNGAPIFDNPPFYLWLCAISYKIFGVTEYAAKFPSALMGVLTVALTFALARRLFDAWTAFIAAFALIVTPTFSKYARHAMMDVTLTFFVCLSLFSLVLAIEKDRRYFLLWGASIAIGVLIKSVLGFFPLLISVVCLALTKNFKLLFSRYAIGGGLIILALGGFWHVHQWHNYRDSFLNLHFGWLIVERGFQMAPEPWYAHLSYGKDLLTYYWPWLPFFILGIFQMVKKIRQRDARALLLLLWIMSYLIILSAMQSRRLWYIMPIFPAASMIAAYAIQRLCSPRAKLIFAKAIFILLIATSILLNATPIQVASERERDIRILAPYVKHFGNQGARIIAFRKDYFGLNGALQFYSDFAAMPVYDETAELRAAMQTEQAVLCLVDDPVRQALAAEIGNHYVVKKTERLVLISNRVLDASDVKTW